MARLRIRVAKLPLPIRLHILYVISNIIINTVGRLVHWNNIGSGLTDNADCPTLPNYAYV